MKLDIIKKIIYSKEQDNYDKVYDEYKALIDEFEIKSEYMSEEETKELLNKIKCKDKDVDNTINPSELDTDVIALDVYSFVMNPDNEEFLSINAKLLDCKGLKDITAFKKVKNTKYVSEHLMEQAQSGIFDDSDINFLEDMVQIAKKYPDDYETIIEDFKSIDDCEGVDVAKVLAAVYLANGKEGFDLLKKASIAGYNIYGDTPIKDVTHSRAKKYDVIGNTTIITAPNSGYSKLSADEMAGLIMFPEAIYDQNSKLRSANEIRETLCDNILKEAKEYDSEIEIDPKIIYEESPIKFIEKYHIEQINEERRVELWNRIDALFAKGKR